MLYAAATVVQLSLASAVYFNAQLTVAGGMVQGAVGVVGVTGVVTFTTTFGASTQRVSPGKMLLHAADKNGLYAVIPVTPVVTLFAVATVEQVSL